MRHPERHRAVCGAPPMSTAIVNYGPGASRCPHCDCPNPYCACVLFTRVENAERRAAESGALAHSYRYLWECAASCLEHNAAKVKPRGKDEGRMLELAKRDGPQGKFWSGKTDGWI